MNFENMIEKHSFTLPSSKKKLILRPILVKEEKILMMKKSNSNDEFLNTLLQVIENCTVNKNEILWKNMSYNDFAFAFVKLREISRDDTVSVSLNCSNKECKYFRKEDIEKTLDIDKTFNIKDILKIENEGNKYSKIVKVNDEYSLQLKEVTLGFLLKMNEDEMKDKTPFLINVDLIIEHTEAILKENEKIIDRNEIKEFIEHLRMRDISEIYKWFSNEPKIKIETRWICNECKTDNVFEEVDVINFFDIS